jgi:hypothetical protein
MKTLSSSAFERPANGSAVDARRRVLGGVVAIIAGLALPWRQLREVAIDPRHLGKRIAALLGYGSQFPAMDFNESALASMLSAILQVDAADFRRIASLSDRELKTRIEGQITQDYSRGDIVNHHGWWIAATEAQCLALVGAA